MQSSIYSISGDNIYINKESFELAKVNESFRDRVISKVIPLLSEEYDLNKDRDGFYKIYHSNMPIFLKLCFSYKTDNMFITLRVYGRIRDNGVKENSFKKNYQLNDGIINIKSFKCKINDLIQPILIKNQRFTIINEQIEKIKNIYSTLNLNNQRKIDIGFQDRGDINSEMRLTIRNLKEEDVNFILSMLSLVNDG